MKLIKWICGNDICLQYVSRNPKKPDSCPRCGSEMRKVGILEAIKARKVYNQRKMVL